MRKNAFYVQQHAFYHESHLLDLEVQGPVGQHDGDNGRLPHRDEPLVQGALHHFGAAVIPHLQ